MHKILLVSMSCLAAGSLALSPVASPQQSANVAPEPSSHVAMRIDVARHDPTLLRPDGTPFDGTGITIAVVDFGIDSTHTAFVQDGRTKVVRNLRAACEGVHPCDDWIELSNTDDDGHGTMAASIAAGHERVTAHGDTVRGTAPGASLVGLSERGGLLEKAGLNGLRWVLRNHADPCGDGSCPAIRIVTNSWGPPAPSPETQQEIIDSITALLDAGIVVVWAAGNIDPIFNPDDDVPQTWRSTRPGFIRVGNYHDLGGGSRDGEVADDSLPGLPGLPDTYPDLVAPGTSVPAACSKTQVRCAQTDFRGDPRYGLADGTSFAAPAVAGIVATLLEADPSLQLAEVEDVLEDTAHVFGWQKREVDPTNPDHRISFDRGHGLVDAAAALARVLERRAPRPPACPARVTDVPGDTYIQSDGPTVKGPVDHTIDLLSAWVHEVDGNIRFSYRLRDLSPGLASGPSLPYFVHAVTLRGRRTMIAIDALVPGQPSRFQLATDARLVNREVIADLQGTVDMASNTVTVDVPRDAWHAWDPTLPVLARGERLHSLVVETRSFGSQQSDQLAFPCPFVATVR